MKNIKVSVSTMIVVTLLVVIPGLAQTTVQPTGKLPSITVKKFDIKTGVEFPVASLDVMMNEIVDEILKTKRFSQVRLDPPAPMVKPDNTGGEVKAVPPITENTAMPATDETDIILTGTITKYQPGNRATRYLIGFGAGKTKVVAAIKVMDKATGKVLLEKDVDGKVIIGVFGGDSNGATRGLAKEVASTTKKARTH